jgi:hypothetical protein
MKWTKLVLIGIVYGMILGALSAWAYKSGEYDKAHPYITDGRYNGQGSPFVDEHYKEQYPNRYCRGCIPYLYVSR